MPEAPLRGARTPTERASSMMVETLHHVSPTSLTQPTMPFFVITAMLTRMPWTLPRFRVRSVRWFSPSRPMTVPSSMVKVGYSDFMPRNSRSLSFSASSLSARSICSRNALFSSSSSEFCFSSSFTDRNCLPNPSTAPQKRFPTNRNGVATVPTTFRTNARYPISEKTDIKTAIAAATDRQTMKNLFLNSFMI